VLKDIVIIGAGNPDIIRLINDINIEKNRYNILGITEKDTKFHGNEIWGYPILGGDDILEKKVFRNVLIVNNVYKDQNARMVVSKKLERYEYQFCNLIHPSSRVGNLKIGLGNTIFDGVIIQSGSEIGNYNILHSASVIGHETIVGDNCLISVGVSVGSRNVIGDYCFFGIASCSYPGLKICDFTFIGGGAVVSRDVSEQCTLFGNPARVIPKM